MDNNHILNHEIEWSKGGVQPAQNRAHHLYLDRMSKQVLEVLKREFSCHITEHVQQIDPTSKLYQEISQHVSLCQERYIICRLSKIVYLVLNCFKVYFPFYFYDTISISLHLFFVITEDGISKADGNCYKQWNRISVQSVVCL